MCLSIPMQVAALEAGGDLAWVERPGRRERVNMLLTGRQPLGTWVLVSLGFAREVVEGDALALIEDALAALAEGLEGTYDPADHFADLGVPAAAADRASAADPAATVEPVIPANAGIQGFPAADGFPLSRE